MYDSLLNIALNKKTAKNTKAPIIQICGLQGEISSVHLSQNGLYFAVPQRKLKIPSSISDMNTFIDTFENLYDFVISFS